MKIKTNIVYDYLEQSKNKITVLQGGSRSGKTYNVLIWLIIKLLNEDNKILSICRASLPTIRGTVLRDFISILDDMGIYDESLHNKSEGTYKLGNNIVEFISTDQPQKIRGRKRDYLFINEANELEFEGWIQLVMRTGDKIILDYNPSMEYHWIYDKVITRDDADFFITTYKDNPFLDAKIISEIERLRDGDSMYWQVYGEGQRGVWKTTVYTHWKIKDEMPNEGEIIYGLDFGFNHPTALIQVENFDGAIWAKQLLYESNLTTPDLIRRLEKIGLRKHDKIYADSARPETIEEVKRAGFNIVATKKGPNSVMDGINKLRSMPLYISKHSMDLIKELQGYKWIEKNGKVTDEPIKANDDAVDALRYAVFSHFTKQKLTWVAF